MANLRKIIGYVVAIIGLLAVILSFEQVSSVVNIPLPAVLTPTYLLYGGVVLIVIGLLLAFMSRGSSGPRDVPVYQGKDVVAFRRSGK